jgi:starch phosphorylase
VGAENFFLFGLTAEEVAAHRTNGYSPFEACRKTPELSQAIEQIASNRFSPERPGLFQPLVDALLSSDHYLITADYAAYVAQQDLAEQAYRDADGWARKSILNMARCGFFSSDRAVQQYCEDIWKINPLRVVAEQEPRRPA